MFLILFSVLSVNAVELEVKGDITIDVTVIDEEDEEVTLPDSPTRMKAIQREESSGEKEKQETQRLSMVTAAVKVECVYQYPEREQVEALLSNMMNQLAKVYVRVREFVTDTNEWGERRSETRFKVVESRNVTHFDEIYANMTLEYRNLYSNTTYVMPRTGDPCSNQAELKRVWVQLLESSVTYLRAAVARSIAHFMKQTPSAQSKKAAVKQLVKNELARIKASQLDILCDKFQLCYNELL
ncbi:uncharacterized protein LOC128673223 [Plodia interpunctella]|uniref:uncharacterized protein LOC128673223 n=1 Tax=Plodia interpunctella TaxID=58824 RepID=UPI002368EB5E|nr:uncharacterized protein LOC128673223 [Plodia interpunctella]